MALLTLPPPRGNSKFFAKPGGEAPPRPRPAPLSSRTTMACIFREVREEFQVDQEALIGRGRRLVIVAPRQVVMYLAKELTSRNFTEIGRFLGGRDHTTILHGWRRVKWKISTDARIAARVDALRRRLVAP